MAPMLLLTDADRFPFDAGNRSAIAAAGAELVELDGHDPERIVAAGARATVLFAYHAKVDAELLDRLPELRVIARCGSGYDRIDVDAAQTRGVVVTYVPDYGIDDVADHTLALLLACARRVGVSDRAMRAGGWPPYQDLGEMRRLSGGVLGLLGFGRIAQAVAVRARGFGMGLLALDPAIDDATLTRAGAARARELPELLAASDVLSIHLPLTPTTEALIGAAELAQLRPGALLVNTSRGEIVDEAALAAALAGGHLGGAGLDVFAVEPLPPDSPLIGLESAVLTPHSAAFSEQALAEVRSRALADALRVIAGDPPRDPVPVVR